MSSGGAGHRRDGLVRYGSILLLAALLTGLNVSKPLVVDDAVYHQIARHLSVAGSDPYGFEIDWYDEPEPAIRVLAPPVLPYWWSLGIRLLGEDPRLWKLWGLPFALLLVWALDRLLARLVPRDRTALLVLLVVSPALLPFVNLMLDVPALALGLAGLVLTLEAVDRERGLVGSLAAGLVCGVAMQTKYTALLPLMAGLLHAAMAGRPGRALLIGSIASSVFVSWEVFAVARYGESHFMNGVRTVEGFAPASAWSWFGAFACLVAASSSALLPIVVRGVVPSRRASTLSAWVVGLAWASVALFQGARIPSVAPIFPTGLARVGGEAILAGLLGISLIAGAAWMVLRFVMSRPDPRSLVRVRSLHSDATLRLDFFLLSWLLIELIGTFALSPYPALRRVLGVHVALTFALGRASAALSIPSHAVRVAAVLAVAITSLFWISDFSDAHSRRRAAELAAKRVAEELTRGDAGGSGWALGHWGFQFYAERGGLRPVLANRTRFERGDVIALARGVHRPRVVLLPDHLTRFDRIVAINPWPWSTLPGAYAGYRPIRPQAAAQLEIVLFRVTKAFDARLVTPDAPPPAGP